ncbi:PilZ domain-containing protein [Noviherbaspirillum sp. CPCC 100848]|uniref:PilZ domain-containing protein n=1 Tax=Noviherbaspirillum album TaxID=3080276 RepID=A0ABU6JGS1_9BURK|nr:PilZ domain-containing protein [Noviherbaspirillum sp. CPCC 100848]MEC4722852.1 PilZ domain-containing protein [Noviherbaspirillum sp. CPCC 100848]
MHSFSAFKRRLHRRQYCSFDAKVLMDDVGPYSVITLDVSLHGLGLFSHRPLVIGRNYAIAIEVPDSPRRINAWGTVVYCDPTEEGFSAGVRFLDMDAYSKACIEDLLTSHVVAVC